MGDPLHLTILYEEGDDGWIVSSIPEVPGVLGQGRTKKEAREMALDALAGMLKLRAAEHEPQGKAGAESNPDKVARSYAREVSGGKYEYGGPSAAAYSGLY